MFVLLIMLQHKVMGRESGVAPAGPESSTKESLRRNLVQLVEEMTKYVTDPGVQSSGDLLRWSAQSRESYHLERKWSIFCEFSNAA